MASFVKYRSCSVCQNPDDGVVDSINADILNGIALTEIKTKYAAQFGSVSYNSLFHHKKHLLRSASAEVTGLPDLTSDQGELANPERSKSFTTYTQTLNNNHELLEMVVDSAIEDLDKSEVYLEKANSVKGQAMILGVRDNIRKSVTDVAKIRQELIDPALTVNGQVSNAVMCEFLSLVKRAALFAIDDEKMRISFFNQVKIELRKSKELKWMVEQTMEDQQKMPAHPPTLDT